MNRLDRDGLPACGQIDKTLSKIDHQRAARCERPQTALSRRCPSLRRRSLHYALQTFIITAYV
jgi:hypothetical protein